MTLKDANRFFTVSSPRPNCLVHVRLSVQGAVAYNIPGMYHVLNVVCHVVLRDSFPVKFDRAKTSFIFASFHWMKLLTDEGKEKSEEPGNNPRASEKNHILQAEISSQNRGSNPRCSISSRRSLGKLTS